MGSATNSFALSETEKEMVRHIIDIQQLEYLKTPESCIYKVPYNLRKVNEEAYTPYSISIGPLHFGKDELQAMQNQKLRYFHFFWERLSNKQAIVDFKNYLERKEEAIRKCYAEKFTHIRKDKFVDMLLLDAVFTMELFLRIVSWKDNSVEMNSAQSKYNDYILNQTWLNKSIQRDLLLLENQLPFFVLKKLYKIVFPCANKDLSSFLHLAHEYFACFDPRKCSSADETKKENLEKEHSEHFTCSICCSLLENGKKPLHFTDLIRKSYLIPKLSPSVLRTATKFCLTPKQKGDPSPSVLRTATKLQEAGVSFERVQKKCLLDIKFERLPFLSWFLCLGCIPKLKWFKARLRIPQLKVDHTTECVLRNLIAFEQCHYPDQPYICNYVSLIDSLIHTKDDVEILVEKEVIVHELGSDKEVASLVNKLCKHVVTNSTCYKHTIDDLNKHYQSIWNRTMAALRLVYFRDTWRASSTLVGIAVLVFTIFNFCRVVRVLL